MPFSIITLIPPLGAEMKLSAEQLVTDLKAHFTLELLLSFSLHCPYQTENHENDR